MERRDAEHVDLLPRALSGLVQRHADSPAQLWEWIERLQDARRPAANAHDRWLGAVHTPARVAALMAQRLLPRRVGGRVLRLLDAGCGAGILSTAVLRAASPLGMRLDCTGVETDLAAARWAQALEPLLRATGATLQAWTIVHADFLLDYAPAERFDVIVANPPYVPARLLPAAYRRKLQAQGTRGARADLSVLFCERMLELLRPQGRLCVIVPNKLLAADYAAPLRQRLLRDFCVEEVWDLAADGVFAARAAYPVILVVANRRPPRDHAVAMHAADGTLRTRWPQSALRALPQHVVPLHLPAEAWPLLQRLLAGPRFGDAVRVGCGLATPGFQRAMDRGRDRILCSGDIGPFRVHSSRRFASRTLALPARTLARQRVPKVVIPGMFQRLHAAFDARGDLLGRVYFVPVGRRAASQRALLLALLNSRLYAVLYRGLFGGVAQSRGYLRLNAPYLRRLPWPAREPSPGLVAAVVRLERADEAAPDRTRLDRGVEDLFELTEGERRLLARLERQLHTPLRERPRTARKSSRRDRAAAARRS